MPTRLADWFEANPHKRQVEFAKEVGCSPAYISSLVNGRRLPGRAMSLMIERATRGAVQVADWPAQPRPRRKPNGRDSQ